MQPGRGIADHEVAEADFHQRATLRAHGQRRNDLLGKKKKKKKSWRATSRPRLVRRGKVEIGGQPFSIVLDAQQDPFVRLLARSTVIVAASLVIEGVFDRVRHEFGNDERPRGPPVPMRDRARRPTPRSGCCPLRRRAQDVAAEIFQKGREGQLLAIGSCSLRWISARFRPAGVAASVPRPSWRFVLDRPPAACGAARDTDGKIVGNAGAAFRLNIQVLDWARRRRWCPRSSIEIVQPILKQSYGMIANIDRRRQRRRSPVPGPPASIPKLLKGRNEGELREVSERRQKPQRHNIAPEPVLRESGADYGAERRSQKGENRRAEARGRGTKTQDPNAKTNRKPGRRYAAGRLAPAGRPQAR